MKEPIDPSVIIPLSYYEELITLLNSTLKDSWISPKLKLPPEGDEVLLLAEYKWINNSGVHSTSNSIYVGRLICLKNGKKYFSSKYKLQLQEIKYWMHIPLPPIQEI